MWTGDKSGNVTLTSSSLAKFIQGCGLFNDPICQNLDEFSCVSVSINVLISLSSSVTIPNAVVLPRLIAR
jgi:hypothetical protein